MKKHYLCPCTKGKCLNRLPSEKLLLERCIRKAKWVGAHGNSLVLNKVPIEEFDQIFHYGMKDICDLDHLNQVVDLDNSSFYQATHQ